MLKAEALKSSFLNMYSFPLRTSKISCFSSSSIMVRASFVFGLVNFVAIPSHIWQLYQYIPIHRWVYNSVPHFIELKRNENMNNSYYQLCYYLISIGFHMRTKIINDVMPKARPFNLSVRKNQVYYTVICI